MPTGNDSPSSPAIAYEREGQVRRKAGMAVTILDRIIAAKRLEVDRLPRQAVGPQEVKEVLDTRGEGRDFFAALQRPRAGRVALIAEIKQASPSAGLIRADFDPVRIAREYAKGGATCLSVLTDEQFFQGSLAHLREVRAAVGLPLLRKDFVIDERQVLEAAHWGADAVLLIVSILSDQRLEQLHRLITESGLAALVEVHDELELDRALAVGATLIGVNNRDLKTFKVDLRTTQRIAAGLAHQAGERPVLLVAESGIHTANDIDFLRRCGARAVLVGESLMKADDIARQTRELMACP